MSDGAGARPTIRLARAADAAAIAALSRDRIEHGLGWSWTAPRVLRSIADAATNVVVAVGATNAGCPDGATNAGCPDGSAALHGFGLMKYRDDEAHLLLLAVAAGAVRRGTGSALVAWLEASARVAGIGTVYLEARHANGGARAFYARLGYREIQTVAGYYQGIESAVRLGKDLWASAPVAPP